VIAYCRIGERSSHTWFALQELLGYENVKNDDGSWTEYGSLVGAPVELGLTLVGKAGTHGSRPSSVSATGLHSRSMGAPRYSIRRRISDLVWTAGGLATLLLTGSAVEPDTALVLEVDVFRVFNDAPDLLYPIIWPLMQYGTFITIPAATIVALLFHKVRLAIELGVAGVAVYQLAKLAKEAFPRGRPGAMLADADLRGVSAGEQGFPSGHAAVSAALAFILFAYLPGRWRWIPVALAVIVPAGRMYVGAHFPLDVVGGASLGMATGAIATLIGGVPERRSRGDSDDATGLAST
jgi:membrane-associated phospholipid phosphatase